MTAKVGPKEAQQAALRVNSPHRVDPFIKALPKPLPGWGKKAQKKPASEPKRIGRPADLKAADHEAVGAATPDELAVALRWYRAQLAGARKRRIKA